MLENAEKNAELQLPHFPNANLPVREGLCDELRCLRGLRPLQLV